MSVPPVAIVILNWNNPADTLATLASAGELDYAGKRIIAVDNGSTDDSVAQIRARFPDVTLIETGENLGYAEGNNVGLRRALAADCDYVFILNNDVLLAHDALSQLIAVMEADPGVGMAGPAVFYADPPDRLFSAGSTIDWRYGSTVHVEATGTPAGGAALPADVDFLVGCAVCVRRDVIEATGGLDPAFYLNYEDVDWCVRVRRAGWRVVCVPAAKIWHKTSASLGMGSPRNTYYMTRNALLFFARNGRGLARMTALLCILARTLRTIGAWTVKPVYRNELFRRKRDANLLALRDFALARYGRMGADVESRCCPSRSSRYPSHYPSP